MKSEKDAQKVLELFNCRYNLIKQIYSHNKIIAFELMLSDIFQAADPVYNFKSKVLNPAEFIQLTDNILYEIEISTEPVIFQIIRKKRN